MDTKDARTSYLGRGVRFPMRVNALGSVELVSALEDIDQAIMIILSTRPGERLMRPEFGCRAYDLVFEPRDSVFVGKMQEYVTESLTRWEPRIDLINVRPEIDPDTDGAVYVNIDYVAKSSHDERSIVFPFFIERQEEW
jgi:uncharacterized protein